MRNGESNSIPRKKPAGGRKKGKETIEAQGEKRDHPRTPPQSLISVAFTPRGKTEEHIGLVNDIGPEGVGITSPVRILPGTLLEISPREDEEENLFEKEHFLGEVRWCIPDERDIGIYYLGVKVIGGATSADLC